jgi:hypothetical protein
MANLFERLNRGPRPAEEKTKHKDDPTQKLLDFLLRWPEATISERQVRIYVRPFRDRESVFKSAQILEQQGWLIRDKTCRHQQWQIIRKPVVYPRVDE